MAALALSQRTVGSGRDGHPPEPHPRFVGWLGKAHTTINQSWGQPIRLSGYFSGVRTPAPAQRSGELPVRSISGYSHHPQRGVCAICWNPQHSCVHICSTYLLHTLRKSIRILSRYYPDTGYYPDTIRILTLATHAPSKAHAATSKVLLLPRPHISASVSPAPASPSLSSLPLSSLSSLSSLPSESP
jgi:hypothetical protein